MIASNVVCPVCLRTEDDCRCERWQLRQAHSALARVQAERDRCLEWVNALGTALVVPVGADQEIAIQHARTLRHQAAEVPMLRHQLEQTRAERDALVERVAALEKVLTTITKHPTGSQPLMGMPDDGDEACEQCIAMQIIAENALLPPQQKWESINAWVPLCPDCQKPLESVVQPSNSYLNSEQWDATRAGDYVCDECTCYWVKTPSGLQRSSVDTNYLRELREKRQAPPQQKGDGAP